MQVTVVYENFSLLLRGGIKIMLKVHVEDTENVQKNLLEVLCFKNDTVNPILRITTDFSTQKFKVNTIETRCIEINVVFIYKLVDNILYSQALLPSFIFTFLK